MSTKGAEKIIEKLANGDTRLMDVLVENIEEKHKEDKNALLVQLFAEMAPEQYRQCEGLAQQEKEREEKEQQEQKQQEQQQQPKSRGFQTSSSFADTQKAHPEMEKIQQETEKEKPRSAFDIFMSNREISAGFLREIFGEKGIPKEVEDGLKKTFDDTALNEQERKDIIAGLIRENIPKSNIEAKPVKVNDKKYDATYQLILNKAALREKMSILRGNEYKGKGLDKEFFKQFETPENLNLPPKQFERKLQKKIRNQIDKSDKRPFLQKLASKIVVGAIGVVVAVRDALLTAGAAVIAFGKKVFGILFEKKSKDKATSNEDAKTDNKVEAKGDSTSSEVKQKEEQKQKKEQKEGEEQKEGNTLDSTLSKKLGAVEKQLGELSGLNGEDNKEGEKSVTRPPILTAALTIKERAALLQAQGLQLKAPTSSGAPKPEEQKDQKTSDSKIKSVVKSEIKTDKTETKTDKTEAKTDTTETKTEPETPRTSKMQKSK
ncbi:MAG: hypothetical protein ACHQUC_06705 [Chlamydiales bacterium]